MYGENMNFQHTVFQSLITVHIVICQTRAAQLSDKMQDWSLGTDSRVLSLCCAYSQMWYVTVLGSTVLMTFKTHHAQITTSPPQLGPSEQSGSQY